MSDPDWFRLSKRQNNCSHISRWTLSGLKTLSFTWFSINHVLDSNLIIGIFWGAFVTFTVPRRRNDLHITSSEERVVLQLSISIALYVWIIYISSHFIADIAWRHFYLHNLLSVSAALLERRSNWFTLHASKCNHIHTVSASASKSYFCSVWNKIELFLLIFLRILTISDYIRHKHWMHEIWQSSKTHMHIFTKNILYIGYVLSKCSIKCIKHGS